MVQGVPRTPSSGRRLTRSAAGFTMVELMVVLLIAAILLGVGIPTYIGATHHSEESAAQAALDTALTTAQGYYADHESYAGLDPAKMTTLDPSGDYASSSTPNQNGKAGKIFVGVTAGPDTTENTGGIIGPQSASFSAGAANWTCWYIVDVEAVGSEWISKGTPGINGPDVYYGANPDTSHGSCAPLIPGTAPASDWQPQGCSQSDWANVHPSGPTSSGQGSCATTGSATPTTAATTTTTVAPTTTTTVAPTTTTTVPPATVFDYTGSVQTYTVPSGVTELTVVASGGAGGDGTRQSTLSGPSSATSQGGQGAVMHATISVSSGETLDIIVGEAGASGNDGGYGYTGGVSGGRDGGEVICTQYSYFYCAGPGGGSTAIVDAATSSPLIIVGAGGGGGSPGSTSYTLPSGGDGGPSGTAGTTSDQSYSGGGGGGATPTSGGAAGTPNAGSSDVAGSPGSQFVGGFGSAGSAGSSSGGIPGGSGGGGAYGGGGGGNGGNMGGGGGGGSSSTGSGVSGVSYGSGNTGNGSVKITPN